MCQVTFSNTCLSHWHRYQLGGPRIVRYCPDLHINPDWPLSFPHIVHLGCRLNFLKLISLISSKNEKAILKTTFNIPILIVIGPTLVCSRWLEQLYYLMTNDRELSGFACKAINLQCCHFSILQLETLANASWLGFQRSRSTWWSLWQVKVCSCDNVGGGAGHPGGHNAPNYPTSLANMQPLCCQDMGFWF